MAAVPDDQEIITKINTCFQLYDRKRDGTCDERDIGILIRALGLNPTHENADRLLEEMRGDDPSSFVKRERFESVMLRVMKSQSLKDSEVPKDNEETILRAFQALDPANRCAQHSPRPRSTLRATPACPPICAPSVSARSPG